MRFRTGVLVGLAVGYVFGTRAGRARYLQIKDRWDGFAESPMVQAAVEPVKEAIEPVVQPIREAMRPTGTDDESVLSADQLKERLATPGSPTEVRLGARQLPGETVRERF